MQRIEIIEKYLITRYYDYKPDKLVYAAIEKINACNGLLGIKDLTNSLYISQDAFEKRFRKMVGTTPKQFSSIVKMKAIIRRNPTPLSFLDLALENGYYDQPHFNRDFKLFTGQTPTDFFKKSASYW
jgi:AraC-like DNA-binding protein